MRALTVAALAAATACGSPPDQPTSDSSTPAPDGALSVQPADPSLPPRGTVEFAVQAAATPATQVTWSIVEGSTGGSVTSGGLYTAPGAAGTYHVVATSVADPSVKGSATVSVTIAAPPPPPTSGSPYCSKLVSDTGSHGQPTLGKPGYLQPVVDPVFGTTLTRITGDVGTPVGSTGDTWSDMTYSIYPKLAAWSAPDAQGHSILQIDFTHQTGHAPIFLDGDTYQPLWVKGGRSAANVFDRRWHPIIPETAVEVDQTTGDIRFWNVRTDVKTKVYSGGLSSSALVAIGPAEGNITQDGRFVLVSVGRGTSGPPYFYVVDMTACMPSPTAGCAFKKTGNVTIASVGISSLDWASMSPKGTYILVSRSYQETAVLDWNQSTGAVNTTRRATFAAGHFDLTVGADGTEYAQPGNGLMYRLSDGAKTTVWNNGAGAYHSGSMRLGKLTGWTLAGDEDPASIAAGELIAYGTSGQFYRLAHHRMVGGDGPHAVPSPDGKRVFFGSNWGDSAGPIQGYVIDTRKLCP